MPNKKKSRKTQKSAFFGSLDRLKGKKLMQHGAEVSSSGKEMRKHFSDAGKRS